MRLHQPLETQKSRNELETHKNDISESWKFLKL